MNSYQTIKEHVSNNLRKSSNTLSEGAIGKEVNNIRSAIEHIGSDSLAQILAVPKLDNLVSNDWDRMQRELEAEFDVKMEKGILIQGEQQQERDNVWWTEEKKQDGENFYWNRYRNHLATSFPKEVIKAIDTDTDIIMNNIENPEFEKFSRHGMVVGHVQSGKTANYSALVCKAADAGYKFIVVIAGGINNLRDQTQKRLNESFIGMDKGLQTGAGVGEAPLDKLPISLTTVEADFNKQDADKNSQAMNFDNINTPLLLVIKKNTHTLENVIKWLESQYKNQISKHSMLMIDDESDYASINTKKEEDPTTINRKLRKILSIFSKSAYVAYTATPYANIFIDHEAGHNDIGQDLFPKDFIYALDAPNNYFGAKRIFHDTEDKHIIDIDDFQDIIPLNHKKDLELPLVPESLNEAIRIFILNVAIRKLRGQENKHNSMLVHATRFTAMHQKLSFNIEEYKDAIKRDVEVYGALPDAKNHSELIKDINKTFIKTYFTNCVKEKLEFEWAEVLNSLCSIINSIVVREVHQSTSVPLEYNDDRATNAIVIGGTSLSRGYTLEGLSVSYFLRSTAFYDTLMQMGRWFGYRPNYDDLCRIYMTDRMRSNFKFIIEATDDLIDDFKQMAKQKRTPNDFGLSVKQRPESALQVTARNKQKNIKEFIFNMKLDGQSKETSWLPLDPINRQKNLSTVKNIVKGIGKEKEKIGNSYLWRDVDNSHIKNFLNNFVVRLTDSIGLDARMPIVFIKEYVDKKDTNWDVALYSGKGNPYMIEDCKINKETRQSKTKNDYIEIHGRRVASGNAESISLGKEEAKGLSSKDIRRALKKPLLRLHILETEEDQALAAFGISFPGDGLSKSETISRKINTVFYKNLIDEMEEDFEELSDD